MFSFRPHIPLLACLLFLLLLCACEKRPDYVMSKGKMKAVLYDYHIAQAMVETQSYGKEKGSRAYIQAVFDKHHITQAEFDSSMIWYNTRSSDLKDIYDAIEQRIKDESEELKLTTGNTEMASIITEGGDTANIWQGRHLLLLRNHPLSNLERFTIKTDTSYRPNDRFLLFANALFLRGDQRSGTSYLNVCLYIRNSEGKTFAQTRQVSDNNLVQLDVTSVSGKPIKSVSGYFYYTSNSTGRNFCIVNNIQLVRMRQTTNADTLNTVTADTLAVEEADTTGHEREQRLSPEELRKSTQGDTRIKIKTSPDVRTPNSFGPTRRRPVQQRRPQPVKP